MVFAHGFNLLYGSLDFPPGSDVVLVSPTGPGRVLKRHARDGSPTSRLPRGAPRRLGRGLGAGRGIRSRRSDAGPLWRTTVREETEVDLFGEQAVLCGGMNALVQAAFETLVENGYSPEIAYLECVHQLKYLADLLHERGLAGFREAISATALYGDLTRGPRVIGEASRREMRAMLEGDPERIVRARVAGRGREPGGRRSMPDWPRGPERHSAARRAGGPLGTRPEARSARKSRNALSKN